MRPSSAPHNISERDRLAYGQSDLGPQAGVVPDA